MKLWLLEHVEECGFWRNPYDKARGFVVRAATEDDARALATKEGGDEIRYGGERAWLDPATSTCTELTADGPASVILRDFAAG